MTEALKILDSLRKGNYEPVYFLQGDETYYIDLISRQIEVHALPKEQQSFNLTVVYGGDIQVSDILNHARRFPMMADRQVVIVKEAQQIGDLNKESGQNQLLQYLEHPVPTTILVLCHKNKTLDGRKALAKVIKKKAVFLESKKIQERDLPGWISGYIKGRGFSATPEAQMMLSESIGNNLERLSNEIEKIMINYVDPVEITPNMVQQFVGISKEYNVFALQKALLKRDIPTAFKIVSYFIANTRQNPVIPIIAVLYSMFTKILAAHAQLLRKQPVDLQALGVNRYFVRDYTEAAHKYDLRKTVENIHLLRLADLHCKGVDSNVSDTEELRELVAKLMN